MIDLTINAQARERNIQRAREQKIIIPTIAQMRNPEKIPEKIREQLKGVGMQDINPLNLFRITWKNEPVERGGLFGGPNYIVLPSSLTGVKAKILLLTGRYFPTGCHKVGASVGCLVPRLVTGQFDTSKNKAVWPSTGNYCRGGAFNSKLLGCYSVAILHQGMSRERFECLETVASEIIATPGSESNVKEIFDKTHELEQQPDCMIFNQFAEMGNYMWHYHVTGNAILEAFDRINSGKDHLFGAVFTSGSAGTMASGDRIKDVLPGAKLGVGEAVQCPTLLNNGFGEHRIEGIGDKHVPWIHNVKNTDLVVGIDDEDALKVLRLFNEKEGIACLKEAGVPEETINVLSLFGISGIANMLCAIKMAKYYELTEHDVVASVMTDSAVMYQSRIEEMAQQDGPYTREMAAVDFHMHILGEKTDSMMELTYPERKRVHNLKYYTWVEQQGKTSEELNALWYDKENTWDSVKADAEKVDELIRAFNEDTGLLKEL